MNNLSLEECIRNLTKHGFETAVLPSVETAGERLRQEIEKFAPRTVSYGDSLTVKATGIIEELKNNPDITLYDGFNENASSKENMEKRRQGLLSDIFITGINAITEGGHLHWVDMTGNRIAPIAFGPKKVILLAGINKLVNTDSEAIWRIRKIAAPQNAQRHPDFKTPCVKTGECIDCNSPQRICNSRLILERCFPQKRILVILIEENVGL